MEVVILAGGYATRMGELAKRTPKVLLPVAGVPLLDLNLSLLASQGFTEFCICTGHLADEIEQHVATSPVAGRLRARLSRETVPLGTAGAVRAISPRPEGDFLVVYGDVLAATDFRALVEAHLIAGADATLLVHPNDHPQDSDLVEVDATGRVAALHPKSARRGDLPNLASAAVYVLSPAVLDQVDGDRPEDFFADLFPRLLESGRIIQSVRNYGFVKDAGTPERLNQVSRTVLGSPEILQINHRRPAVLLDRDGVVVEARPHIADRENLVLLNGSAAAIARLNRARFLTALVTNQPVVARGDLSEEGLQQLHRALETELGFEGAHLDAIEFCPHHPHQGFAGEVPELKIHCRCRKPAPGMGESALGSLPIDTGRTFMIGDSGADLLFGRRLGVFPIGVLSGANFSDGLIELGPEELLVPDLVAAVDFILDTLPSLRSVAEDVATRGAATVLVGGRSRAGKTVVASALRYWLRSMRRPVVHLSLDRWIVPPHLRRPGSSVLERFGGDASMEEIRRIVLEKGIHMVPRSTLRRKALPPEPIASGPETVFILDGPHALLLRESLGGMGIYVEVEEELARARFHTLYGWKSDLPAARIEQLYEERREEVDLVASTAALADVTLAWNGRRAIVQ